MTLEEMAKKINKESGYTDKKLTVTTLLMAAALADLVGNKETGDYFAARAKEEATS